MSFHLFRSSSIYFNDIFQFSVYYCCTSFLKFISMDFIILCSCGCNYFWNWIFYISHILQSRLTHLSIAIVLWWIWQNFIYKIISSANRDNFTFHFPIWMLKVIFLAEGERREWKDWLKPQHSKSRDRGIQFHHFMANWWRRSGNSDKFYFHGLQNYCGWWLQAWN